MDSSIARPCRLTVSCRFAAPIAACRADRYTATAASKKEMIPIPPDSGDGSECPVVLGDQRPQLLGRQGAYMLVQAREVDHERGYGLGRETGTFDRVQR